MLFSLFCVSFLALALFVLELNFRNLPLLFFVFGLIFSGFIFVVFLYFPYFLYFLYFGNCLPLLVALQRLQGELSPVELAIVEHCATKVNSLNIPRMSNPCLSPTPAVINRRQIKEKLFFPSKAGLGKICAFKLTCTQHVSNFIFTTCVAHKKLIQSAQYNLYPIWTTTNKGTTEKPAGKDEKIRQGTWEMGRGPKKKNQRCSIAHSNQPKKASEIFCNFYDPKRRINSEGQISEQRTPIHTQ